MKLEYGETVEEIFGHPPCGGCGLKLIIEDFASASSVSPSVWRVWIEICSASSFASNCAGHPPCGGCGLKYSKALIFRSANESPSVWRVWIEMQLEASGALEAGVTLRVEGVD